MLWGIRHGKNYRTSYGTMLLNNMAIPDEWVNPPTLPPHLVWVRDAYYKLSTCRPSGFGITPIPWTAVIKYAEYMGLDDYETDWFEELISTMDDEIVKYYSEKNPKEKTDGK